MTDLARRKLDQGRDHYLQSVARRSASPQPPSYLGAGNEDGNPLLATPGGTPTQYGRQLSSGSIRDGEEVAVFRGDRISRVVGRDRIVRDEDEDAAIVPTELAWVMLYNDGIPTFGVGTSFNYQFYVGGICPTLLAFEINELPPFSREFTRERYMEYALALEDRGAILEIRLGRLYPFGLQLGASPPDPVPSDTFPEINPQSAQVLDPNSDYYRYVSRRAFLITRDGIVTEIPPGTTEAIGAWEYERREYFINWQLLDPTPVALTDFCAQNLLQPGSENNYYKGKLTVPRFNPVIPGEQIILSRRFASEAVGTTLITAANPLPEVTIYLCAANLETSPTECQATVTQVKPFVITRPDFIVDLFAPGTYRFLISGNLAS